MVESLVAYLNIDDLSECTRVDDLLYSPVVGRVSQNYFVNVVHNQ